MHTAYRPILNAVDDDGTTPIRTRRRHRIHWIAVALRSIAAVVAGLLTLVMPELSVAVLLSLLAGYTLVSAGAALDVARETDRRREAAWPFLVYGVAAAAVAAFLLWWPMATLAVQLRRAMPRAWLLGAVGATSIVAALALLAQPAWVADTEARVIGVYALLSGVFLGGFAVRLRREQRALRRTVHPAHAHADSSGHRPISRT